MRIGYARVSTQDQSLDMQVSALREIGCDVIYQEKISSRKDRPELNRCIDMISSTKGNHTLIIYKLDRLSRSILDLKTIVDVLERSNCGLESITDRFDTSTAQGRMFFNMLGVFAEFERDIISERTKAGLEQVRNNGVKLGRPQYLDKSKVRAARKMKKQGYMTDFILDTLNISRSTLYRYLKK